MTPPLAPWGHPVPDDFLEAANHALADCRAWATPHGIATARDITDAELEEILERLYRLRAELYGTAGDACTCIHRED